jgi:hypothetical protein
MNRITTARARIDQAGDLPSLLGAAYGAFEDMLAVIRQHEERDEGSFAAFVIAAGAAANGRDCIAAAPSLPSSAVVGPVTGTNGLLAELTVVRVALTVAGLSDLLAARLTAAAARAAHPDDRTACTNAAWQARRIWRLFAGAREP